MNQHNNELLERLLNSELAASISQEIDDEAPAKRKQLVTKVKTHQLRLSEIPGLDKKVSKAKDIVDKTTKALDKAQSELRRATHARYELSNQIEGRSNRFNKELRDTAPSYIDECLLWVEEAYHYTSQVTATTGANKDLSQVYTGTNKSPKTYFSNMPSLERRMQAIKELKVLVQGWKLQALTVNEMGEIFETKKAELPEVESEKIYAES